MTMHKIFNTKRGVDRLYLPTKKGGRGLIGCKECVRTEENGLGWYVKQSVEALLKEERYRIITDKAVDPKTLKKEIYIERENIWKGKSMHRQFLKDVEGNDLVNCWKWLSRGDMKGPTEALTRSTQEQSLRTNYVKFKIDQAMGLLLCRMCGGKSDSVTHVASECADEMTILNI